MPVPRKLIGRCITFHRLDAPAMTTAIADVMHQHNGVCDLHGFTPGKSKREEPPATCTTMVLAQPAAH